MNRALIVVDLQEDFTEGGALEVIGGDRVARWISQWFADDDLDSEYVTIVATKDWHENPGDHWASIAGVEVNPETGHWPDHCAAGSLGAAFDANFTPDAVLRIDRVFYKGRDKAAYSGFEGADSGGMPLDEYLRSRNIDEVDVVGLAFGHCVKATALDAVKQGFKPTVLKHYTASVFPDNDDADMNEMREAGVKVIGGDAGLDV